MIDPRTLFNRKLPLWYQLAQMVRTEILASQFAAGGRIPAELNLAKQYGVSVVTVRQALKSLEEEGLISRHRGRGTFVTPGAHPPKELRLMGSVESIIAQQMSEETEVLGHGVTAVPDHLAHHFGAQREVVLFRRLRREQGLPLSYALNYVALEHGSQIDATLLRRYPMLKICRDIIGIKLSQVQISIEAQRASQEVAQVLGVDVFSPVLFFSGVVCDQHHRVVDVALIYYRADRFKFTIDLDVSR
ncbi:MAG TPA: GntR family transcriptional regulator [Methylomirabilota bacterium]|nr:GntR family transcriptional regulator [Methylomirabilota bacterium]